MTCPEHVRRNRRVWDSWAEQYIAAGEAAWAQGTPTWGIWGVPESQVGMFPEDVAGKDAIELAAGPPMSRRGSPGEERAWWASTTQRRN